MIAYLVFVFAKIFLALIQRLPLHLVRRLARGTGYFIWFLDPIHRRVALKNLEIAFDEGNSRLQDSDIQDPASRIQYPEIARESFLRFFENVASTIWMARRNDSEVQSLYEVIGVKQNLLPEIAQKRGIIHVIFHMGNWEVLARMVSQIPEVHFSTIYQPLKNPYINGMISRWRKQSGVGLINRHEGFQEAVKRLRQGEAVGLLVDQHAGDHGMWVPFFDRLASTTSLPAILARRTGAAIVPIFCWSTNSKGEKHVSQSSQSLGEKENARCFESKHLAKSSETNFSKKLYLTFLSKVRQSSLWLCERFFNESDKKINPIWRIEFADPISPTGLSDGEIMHRIHSRLEEAIRQDPANWFWLHDRWKTPSPNFLLKGYRRGVYVPPSLKLKPFRILLRSPNWLGDAVLSIPAVRAIRAGRPDGHITILTPPKLTDFWKSQTYVDQVVVSMKEASRKSFDAAILFPNSLRSALEAWILGIPRRQGYAGHDRRWLLTAICPETFRAGLFEHDVKNFCGLARWSGGEIESEIPKLEVPKRDIPSSEFRVPSSMSDVPHSAFRTPHSYVVLHPGAAFGSAKRWLPERFIELVKRFPDVQWRLIGSENESNRNASLVRQMGSHVEDWTGRINLTQLMEMMVQSRAIVCNDSGPMHLAAAVGCRVLAIFGSTEPTHTGPLGPGHRVVRHLVECSPCYLRECPIDLRCMKGVDVDEVEKNLREMLVS